MAMTSAAQVPRLLALVPYLQAHPDAGVADTARVFGVSARQLVADLKVLWYCGLPGGLPGDLIEIDMDGVESEGRIRLTNAEYLSRPLRFSLDEALSLVVALRALREIAEESLAPAVASALAKLEAVVGGAEVPPVAVTLAGGDAGVRARLGDALASGVAVRLDYQGAGKPATRPLVDPARVVARDGYGYLDAWSRERGAWRRYRLDRIAAVELTDEPVGDHGAPPDDEGRWLDHRPDADLVTLTLAPAARWVTEYHPMESVTPTPDGGAVASLRVADPAWFRTLLLRLGPEVLAVDPPEAAAEAGRAAAEALERYR